MRLVHASLIIFLALASGWRCAAQTGAAVSLPGGARVVVPAGAVQAPTVVTLREVPTPPGVQMPSRTVRVGRFYVVEPPTTFAFPITLTLPYDPSRLPPGYEEGSVSIYQLRTDGRLSMAGSVGRDPESESSGQDIDIEHHVVTIRVRSGATYTLLAAGN